MTDQLLTRGELAQLFGITDDRLAQLTVQGIVIKPERNQYALIESVKNYIQYIKAGNRQSTDIEGEKLLTAQVKRAREELKLKQEQGELISANAVEKEFFEIGRVVRDKLLIVPSKMEIEDKQRLVLEDMLRECLESLVEENN
jgi:phage terminase Nu1 subunit (DNA packaging protein)